MKVWAPQTSGKMEIDCTRSCLLRTTLELSNLSSFCVLRNTSTPASRTESFGRERQAIVISLGPSLKAGLLVLRTPDGYRSCLPSCILGAGSPTVQKTAVVSGRPTPDESRETFRAASLPAISCWSLAKKIHEAPAHLIEPFRGTAAAIVKARASDKVSRSSEDTKAPPSWRGKRTTRRGPAATARKLDSRAVFAASFLPMPLPMRPACRPPRLDCSHNRQWLSKAQGQTARPN